MEEIDKEMTQKVKRAVSKRKKKKKEEEKWSRNESIHHNLKSIEILRSFMR